MDLYEIKRVAPRPKPAPLDVERTTTTMRALQVGDGFTIPAAELADKDGKLRTRSIGWRVHRIAAVLGIRVSVKKRPEGLEIRRERGKR